MLSLEKNKFFIRVIDPTLVICTMICHYFHFLEVLEGEEKHKSISSLGKNGKFYIGNVII